jgi:SAM-dependent methyltransferase
MVMDANKLAEIESAERQLDGSQPREAVKPFGWDSHYWTKWAAIVDLIKLTGLEPPARVLDVGCGIGWTTRFLDEWGFDVTGIDIAPARLRVARDISERWGGGARFACADMDAFDLGERFDLALVFDALHHSDRPRAVVANVARHLRLGGWALFGEPSWLHGLSPDARRATREHGWVERGVRVSALKAACREAGLGDFRRFHEGTQPYEGRVRSFAWQLLRLVAANLWVAPQASVWLAARRVPRPGEAGR